MTDKELEFISTTVDDTAFFLEEASISEGPWEYYNPKNLRKAQDLIEKLIEELRKN